MGKAIVLQFVTERDPVSRAIRWFSDGRYSHVDAVLEDGRLLGAHLEGGVAIRAPGYAPWSAVARVAIARPDEVVDRFYAAVAGEVGKPYDMAAIAGFVAGRDWRLPDHWICSELQAWGLEPAQSGVLPTAFPSPVSAINPWELFLVAVQCGATELVL